MKYTTPDPFGGNIKIQCKDKVLYYSRHMLRVNCKNITEDALKSESISVETISVYVVQVLMWLDSDRTTPGQCINLVACQLAHLWGVHILFKQLVRLLDRCDLCQNQNTNKMINWIIDQGIKDNSFNMRKQNIQLEAGTPLYVGYERHNTRVMCARLGVAFMSDNPPAVITSAVSDAINEFRTYMKGTSVQTPEQIAQKGIIFWEGIFPRIRKGPLTDGMKEPTLGWLSLRAEDVFYQHGVWIGMFTIRNQRYEYIAYESENKARACWNEKITKWKLDQETKKRSESTLIEDEALIPSAKRVKREEDAN
jgi:hypothetical protein